MPHLNSPLTITTPEGTFDGTLQKIVSDGTTRTLVVKCCDGKCRACPAKVNHRVAAQK